MRRAKGHSWKRLNQLCDIGHCEGLNTVVLSGGVGGAGVDGTSNTRDLQRPGVLGFHLLLDELLAHLWASVFFICKGGLIHLMPYRVLARILKVTKKEFKCSLLDKSIGQKKPQRRHGGLVAHRGLKSNSHSHSVWFQLLWVS